MELVLKGLQWRTLLVYLDDIILYSATYPRHLQHLSEVFERLTKAGLKLKPSKCHLLQEEVEFLGHIVSGEGFRPDTKKCEVVKNWPVPKNIHDIRSFLGLCSYYRRFIKNFASIASPLTHLLEAGQAFQWTAQCEEAFEKLKSCLTGYEVMAYPQDDWTQMQATRP